MKLIITTQESFTEHDIVWIEANTTLGNFVIQPDHAPTILILEAQKACIYCLKTGKQESFIPARGGILRVTPHHITALLYA